jgi:hypothetical protein
LPSIHKVGQHEHLRGEIVGHQSRPVITGEILKTVIELKVSITGRPQEGWPLAICPASRSELTL